MKEKLSVTVDAVLVRFLDSLPGDSRSGKLERILRGFKKVAKESALRRVLAQVQEDDTERLEREAWIRTMEVDQWSESGEATSGRSTS